MKCDLLGHNESLALSPQIKIVVAEVLSAGFMTI
jgi:hypothetical protein